MTHPAIPTNDASRPNAREMFGMSLLVPEPELLKAQLNGVRCKSLASVIAHLIADHEPLLKAEADGASVIVSERGGDAVMRFTVEAL